MVVLVEIRLQGVVRNRGKQLGPGDTEWKEEKKYDGGGTGGSWGKVGCNSLSRPKAVRCERGRVGAGGGKLGR